MQRFCNTASTRPALCETVARLLRTIASFLGLALTIGADIGKAVIRYLIDRFLGALANMASLALTRFL
ncbi:hypothetical protein RGUI_4367 (plasmid) [Rhodovulum sp. P5]|uniref:hypothetical protein n=1 Tax=Rhodovulum sp. P5 TaxID=1564506 RepID=UPI0009C3870E|nr:hypothetical protein [Rhodovulum sp. P5]ARE42393.1 hypothetical protein RGUI_4367 [Rhodovulum sp. P5]